MKALAKRIDALEMASPPAKASWLDYSRLTPAQLDRLPGIGEAMARGVAVTDLPVEDLRALASIRIAPRELPA